MMAIENSIAGSILPNYLLLEQFQGRIVGEVYLRIEMSLMALAGQKISDLHSVQSHPMALFQCEDFLFKYPHLKVIEAADTAESAKIIKERGLQGHAAIASSLAAEVYGLELLEKGIETNKRNYTRFLVVSRGERFRPDVPPNKASIRFEVAHRPGSLLSILGSFTAHGINMTKLQSVPILGRPYEYSFHVDLEWEDYSEYQQALREIELKAINLILLGEYAKDERPSV
jgi:prephenate dehydratase